MFLRTFFRSPASDPQRAQVVGDEYARWRRATEGVAESYRGWARAARDERWLAYAAYLAALDREEHAARAYRRVLGHLEDR